MKVNHMSIGNENPDEVSSNTHKIEKENLVPTVLEAKRHVKRGVSFIYLAFIYNYITNK